MVQHRAFVSNTYSGNLQVMDTQNDTTALTPETTNSAGQLVPGVPVTVTVGGSLTFEGGTGGRRPGIGLGMVPAVTAALPALTASLALELAPIRVNLIAAGFVDTPLSATLLGDDLEKRRNQLRATLPIRRVVVAADVAALAVHIMTNTALTGRDLRH